MATQRKIALITHPLFEECNVDPEEVASCISLFCSGDPGSIEDENEVLGFMAKSLKNRVRHGTYETRTGGRIHIVGDNECVAAYPDIIFAMTVCDLDCTVNQCTCFEEAFNDAKNQQQDKV